MENIITYETLRRFAYSNDKLIKGAIRGIVVEFRGLNNTTIYDKDPGDSLEYAQMGIIHVLPYNNPWCWMNKRAVRYTDEIIEVLCEHYGLGADVKIVSTGNSMGGYGTWELAAIRPEWFAAIMPICGGGIGGFAARLVNIPVRTFHGLCDNVDDPIESLQMAKAVNLAGGSCELILFPELDHNCWDRAYTTEENYDWLLSKVR